MALEDILVAGLMLRHVLHALPLKAEPVECHGVFVVCLFARRQSAMAHLKVGWDLQVS
jgi:hypothetical protein